MGTYINGLRCMPYYSSLPEYVDQIYTASNTFVKIAPQTKSVTLSGISGGGGGGIGGIHDTESTFGKIAPAAGAGGGSGLIGTESKTIAELLALVGDTSFDSWAHYGFAVLVGAGGSRSMNVDVAGANGGDSSVWFVKKDSNGETVKSAVAFELSSSDSYGGKGGQSAGRVYGNETAVNGANGGDGGYGGRGGRQGYTYNLNGSDTSSNGVDGKSQLDVNSKHYLFGDPKSKIIVGKGGGSGRGIFGNPLLGRGVDPDEGETVWGAGGDGGSYIGLNNEYYDYTDGISGTSGIVGIRIYYK